MKIPVIPEEMYKNILKAQEVLLEHEIEANTVIINGNKFGVFCKEGYRPTIFGMAVEYGNLPENYDFLVQYKEPQPQTNADRIRSMTDEELAAYYFTEFFGKVPYCHENCPAHDDCQLCLLDWLRQEAK